MKTDKIQSRISTITMIIIGALAILFFAFIAIIQYYRVQEQKIEVENERLQHEIYLKQLENLKDNS